MQDKFFKNHENPQLCRNSLPQWEKWRNLGRSQAEKIEMIKEANTIFLQTALCSMWYDIKKNAAKEMSAEKIKEKSGRSKLCAEEQSENRSKRNSGGNWNIGQEIEIAKIERE